MEITLGHTYRWHATTENGYVRMMMGTKRGKEYDAG